MAQRVAGELYESITGQLFEIARQLRQPTGYPFDAAALKKHLQDAIVGNFAGEPSQAARNTFTVLPGLTLAERITAGGYDWTNSDITEKRFPNDPTTVGEWEWELVGYDHNISSEAAKTALEVDGWVVAKWEHELAFGAAFPEAQRKNPIIALGSVCRVLGGRCVLGLWRDGGERGVDLDDWVVGWNPGCRFLRVRKVSTSVT